MSFRVIGILAIASLFSSSSAGRAREIVFSPDSGAAPIVQNGISERLSKQTSLVRIQVLTPRFGADAISSLGFGIAVYNGTSSPVEFSTANIAAISGDKPVKVYSPSEFAKEINAAYQREMLISKSSYVSANRSTNNLFVASEWTVFKQLAAANQEEDVDPKAPASSQSKASDSKRTRTPGGLMTASARSQKSRQEQALSTRHEQFRGVLHMLRATTVQPKQFASGVLRLRGDDIETDKPLILRVTVDREVHEFTFVVSVK